MIFFKRFVIPLLLLLTSQAFARGVQGYVSTTYADGDFRLSWGSSAADVYVSDAENVAVRNVASLFAEDVERVTGQKPAVKNRVEGLSRCAVIVGTLDKCPVIEGLVKAGKIDVREVRGKWETFLIQVVANPLPGVDVGLVVVGSDRRGAIYGLFDISENMGVSPWYWFADVQPMKQQALVVKKGAYRQGPPSVKYRGIFINDEMWGIRPWASQTYAPEEGQGLGPKTYRSSSCCCGSRPITSGRPCTGGPGRSITMISTGWWPTNTPSSWARRTSSRCSATTSAGPSGTPSIPARRGTI